MNINNNFAYTSVQAGAGTGARITRAVSDLAPAIDTTVQNAGGTNSESEAYSVNISARAQSMAKTAFEQEQSRDAQSFERERDLEKAAFEREQQQDIEAFKREKDREETEFQRRQQMAARMFYRDQQIESARFRARYGETE